MKNIFNRIVALLCIICIIAVSVPVSYAAVSDNDNELLFGRKQLRKYNKRSTLEKAYDRIVECVEAREDEVVLEDLSLTRDELTLVASLYKNDPHGHFWASSGYSYSVYPDGTVYSFIPKYNELGSVSDRMFEVEVNEFHREINAIINKSGVNPTMSQYEIELRLHDTLIDELDYVSTTNAHNSFGAVVEKKAVCQGYTLAFNYLLRNCGIEAHYVSGYSNGVAHSWSLVSIDGSYYYTDITWDDPVGTLDTCNEVFHNYFNLTEKELKSNHTFNEIAYDLPVCDTDVDNYFTHNPERIVNAEPDVNTIASLVTHGSVALYIPDEFVDVFKLWCQDNILELAALVGFDTTKDISYVYSYIGHEYHLIIEGTLLNPDHDHDHDDDKDIVFIFGDVDGDGKITSMDSNLIKRIIAGSLFASETNIRGGDLDSDGILTSIDSNLIKRLIAGS